MTISPHFLLIVVQNISYLPYQGENEEFLGIKWKIHEKIRLENSSYSVSSLKPHSQQPKHSGSTHSREETSPIISHSEVHCGYLDTKKYTCKETTVRVEYQGSCPTYLQQVLRNSWPLRQRRLPPTFLLFYSRSRKCPEIQ